MSSRKPSGLIVNTNSNNSNNNNNNNKHTLITNKNKVINGLQRAGFTGDKSASRSFTLGGVVQSIPRSYQNLGKHIGSGLQGAVYNHKINNKKVVKKRTFKKKRSVYKENTELNRALNQYYSNQLKLVFKNKKFINNNTYSLMIKYPRYFEEAFLQYIAGEANLSAKVHEIFATEEKNTNPIVHIYIVMDKLVPFASTPELRRNLEKKAVRSGIGYQNGSTWGVKPSHVMAKMNSGLPVVINFGNSRFLSPAEIIERGPKPGKTRIKAIGPKNINLSGRI